MATCNYRRGPQEKRKCPVCERKVKRAIGEDWRCKDCRKKKGDS